MSLEEYRKKRNFSRSPEPPAGPPPLRFVIQKHAASHLHYDFRLELDGVLKSWAVPKGPSLDPAVKRLAMRVEDHPFDYKDFEGIIPKGNYGAGRVIIWDAGTYHALGAEDRNGSEPLLRQGLASGDLKFVLNGEKLRGSFALVRTAIAGEKESWLLLKKKDAFAAGGDVTALDQSVVTGKTLAEVTDESREAAAGAGPGVPRAELSAAAAEALAAAAVAPFPRGVKPMLASLVKEPFDDPHWLFEIKLDGYRAMAEVENGTVRLVSRNNLSFNERFAPVVAALASSGRTAVFDGELVILDQEGRSSFQLLQNYQERGAVNGTLAFFLFDILHLDGKELRDLPLLLRKEILQGVLPTDPVIRYTEHVVGSGRDFYGVVRDHGLEGVVAKEGSSRYLAGRRTRAWLKIKTTLRQEAIICGFTAPRGSRQRFGALVLGAFQRGELVYIGHSGGGFTELDLAALHDRLLPFVQETSPFAATVLTNMPVTWVKPLLVCEVSFSQWTEEGLMRHPVFLGLREDKPPHEVRKELPVAGPPSEPRWASAPEVGDREITVAGRKIKLTNLDKIFWLQEKITKGDVIAYYRQVAPMILPYLRDRPQSLYRTPHGLQGGGFYQKNVGELVPDWIAVEKIFSESNDKVIEYLLCQDEATLVYLANLGCIEINPWLSRIGRLDYPDYLVIDLDPEDIPFAKVIDAALAVNEVLKSIHATGYPKTSGATGIHIYIPLAGRYDYDTATTFARLVATMAHGLAPEFTSLERSPSKRQKKVYLDFLQNRRGQTLAAPYSIRPQRGATVSTPLTWDEVAPGLDPAAFTMKTIHSRIGEKGDLFRGVLGTGIEIEECLNRLEQSFG